MWITSKNCWILLRIFQRPNSTSFGLINAFICTKIIYTIQMFQRNKKKNSRIFIISNLMFAFTVFHNTILKHYICGATLHTSRTTRVYFIFEVHCYGVIVSCQKAKYLQRFYFNIYFKLFISRSNEWMVMWTGSHCICHIVQRCCCNNHKLFIFTIEFMKLFDFRLTISVSSLFG